MKRKKKEETCILAVSMSSLYPGRKEGNVLFNDALNTFYLLLYGLRHIVKDHSDSERGNPLRPHGLFLLFLYAPSHRQDSTYHGFVTPVVEHWLEREIAQWVHPMKDRSDDPLHYERKLLPRSYKSIIKSNKYIQSMQYIRLTFHL